LNGNVNENGKNFKFDGNYENGVKSGQGTITFNYEAVNEGREGNENTNQNNESEDYKQVYHGEFKDGKLNGIGYLTFSNQNTYYGSFVDNKMHGKNGKFNWSDGSEYIGEYQNNLKQGFGKFIWNDGKIYEGPFENGKLHGIGTLKVNSNTYQVEFSKGKLVKKNHKHNVKVDYYAQRDI
jgi:hypothetical protein